MKSFTDIFQYENGAAFPNTKAVTSSGPDSFDGTEYNKLFVDEILGFFQAALLTAGVTPNGTTDTAQANQVLDSILSSKKTRLGKFNVYTSGGATQNGSIYCTIDDFTTPAVGAITKRSWTRITFLSVNSDLGAVKCDMGTVAVYHTWLSWDATYGLDPLNYRLLTGGVPVVGLGCMGTKSATSSWLAIHIDYNPYKTKTIGGVSSIPCIEIDGYANNYTDANTIGGIDTILLNGFTFTIEKIPTV